LKLTQAQVQHNEEIIISGESRQELAPYSYQWHCNASAPELEGKPSMATEANW